MGSQLIETGKRKIPMLKFLCSNSRGRLEDVRVRSCESRKGVEQTASRRAFTIVILVRYVR